MKSRCHYIIFYILFALVFVVSPVHADRTGTIIGSGGVTVGSSANTFPSAYMDEIQGGYRTVADVTARDAITSERRGEGMVGYVLSDGRTYRLVGGVTNSDWVDEGTYSDLKGYGSGYSGTN